MLFNFTVFWRLFALTIMSAGLAACTQEYKPLPFIGSDISTANIGQHLELVDSNHTTRTLKDFRNKVVIVFFGFTQCPDVCPTAMVQLAGALELLGQQAERVQVLMITVDPERDTPEIVQSYVQAFDPRFIGLTGTVDQLRRTAQSFKAFYVKAPTAQAGHYSMDHSSAFYLIDTTGKTRALLRGDSSAEAIQHDVLLLLGATT